MPTKSGNDEKTTTEDLYTQFLHFILHPDNDFGFRWTTTFMIAINSVEYLQFPSWCPDFHHTKRADTMDTGNYRDLVK